MLLICMLMALTLCAPRDREVAEILGRMRRAEKHERLMRAKVNRILAELRGVSGGGPGKKADACQLLLGGLQAVPSNSQLLDANTGHGKGMLLDTFEQLNTF